MVGSGGKVEVNGVEDCKFEIDNQMAKYEVMIFAQSKNHTFQGAFLAVFLVFEANSNSSLISHFKSWLFHSYASMQ